MDPIFYYLLGFILLILLIVYICFYKHINLFIVSITGKRRIQKKLYRECKLNDYLILNDVWLPIGDNKYKYVDTIIFGNKFIYITKEIKQAGKVIASLDDLKWRVIYKKSLTLIDNPFLYNKRVINYLTKIVDGLEEKDLKNLVVLAKTCKCDYTTNDKDCILSNENNAIKKIIELEKNSNEDIIDPVEIEKYCNAFYKQGLKAEKIVKSRRN